MNDKRCGMHGLRLALSAIIFGPRLTKAYRMSTVVSLPYSIQSQQPAFSRWHHVSPSQRHTLSTVVRKNMQGQDTIFTRRTARPFASPLTVCPRAAESFTLLVHTGHNINASIPGSNSNCRALVAVAPRQLVHFPLRPRRPTTAAPSSLTTPTCVPSPSPRASRPPPSNLESLAPGGVTAGSAERRKRRARRRRGRG